MDDFIGIFWGKESPVTNHKSRFSHGPSFRMGRESSHQSAGCFKPIEVVSMWAPQT